MNSKSGALGQPRGFGRETAQHVSPPDAGAQEIGREQSEAAVSQASRRRLRRPSSGFQRTFSSLALRDFRRLWIGIVFMMGSMQMLMITQGFLTYELTRSAKILGLVSAGIALPMLLLAPLGGAVADRVERRRVLQIGQAASAAMALGMGVLVLTGAVTWHYLFVMSLGQASLWSFMAPARQSLVPMLVPKEKLSNAMGIAGAGMSVSGLVAPALGGVLYAILGPEGVYFTVSALGLMALAVTTSLPKIPGKPKSSRAPILGEIKAGVAYASANNVVRTLLLASLAIAMISGPVMALMPALIVDVYKLESTAFGLMISAAGIGSLVGALTVAYLGTWRRGLLYLSCGFAFAVTMLTISASPWFFMSVAVMLLFGLGSGAQWSLNQSLGMSNTDDAYRGRVMSIFMMIYGLTPLGTLPAGVVTDIIGPQATVGALGALLLAIAATLLLTQRRFRRLQ